MRPPSAEIQHRRLVGSGVGHGHYYTNPMTASPDIRVFPNAPAVARAAAELIVDAARQAIADHNAFSLVLSGGSTPKLLHQLLADSKEHFRNQIDWPKVEIYFGDERAVPP